MASYLLQLLHDPCTCVVFTSQAELEDTTGVELVQGRSAGRARSMIAVKREKIERAANFARVMRELTMLGSFIRLADYLFVEGRRQSIMICTRKSFVCLGNHGLVCELHGHASRYWGSIDVQKHGKDCWYVCCSDDTGMMDRAICSVDDVLSLLVAPKV
jgi:hypothetical protein